jgi:hypothetical protein
VIKLTPKTHKGKNVTRKWGNIWTERTRTKDKIMIISSNDKSGDSHNLPNSVRWILIHNDPDFDTSMNV